MYIGALKTKPLTQIPDKLIYLRQVNKHFHPEEMEYVVFSTKGQKDYGLMKCHISEMTDVRPDYSGHNLAIDFLHSTTSGLGLGTALINFAKVLSQNLGCNGYIMLKADIGLAPNRIPHIFYKKQGFTSFDKKIDKKLDKFIKKDKDASYKDFKSKLMFYPQPKADKTFLDKFLSFLHIN